jgi:hypothetical protein
VAGNKAAYTMTSATTAATVTGAVIRVLQGATEVASGTGTYGFIESVNADGDSDGSTDFASSEVIFTIENTASAGSDALTISSVAITAGDTTDFDILTNPSTTVAAAGSTTFGIRFDPLYIDPWIATRQATVTIHHDAGNDSPYTFEITATAIQPTVMGYVTDGTNPVEGAYIRLYGPVGTDPPTVDEYDASKVDGYYAFFGIPTGSYYLVIDRDGYDPQTQTVTVP